MTKFWPFVSKLVSAFGRTERGAVAPMVALFTVVLVGVTGFSIDMGHVMWVQRQLQTAADAAALAGAVDVVSAPGNAITLATSYSATAGNKNAFLKTPVTTTAVLKCYTGVPYPACVGGGTSYNAIQVTQQVDVTMWFSQILGIKSTTVTAQATASAKGGNSTALDIMVVLDTTASMNGKDNKCAGATKNTTRLDCAKYGIQQLLFGLDPTKDRLGIIVFPGYTTSTDASSQATCSPSGSISKYDVYSATSAPYYLVAALDNTFKSSSGSTKLNSGSTVVTAVGGGSCTKGNGGLTATGGVQTYYAQAILAAETLLANDGNNASQKVIVLLSDGDANSTSMMSSALNSNPPLDVNECQQAVAAAESATSQGMWVYSVAYGAGTSGTCSTDTSNLGVTVVAGYSQTVNGMGKSACWTLQNIASDTTKFFSDDANGCIGTGGNDADVVALFKSVADSLTLPRLIPNNTT